MRRFKWKRPWHYVVLVSEGYLMGFGISEAIQHYPDWTWMAYGAVGLVGLITWAMTDVLPAD